MFNIGFSANQGLTFRRYSTARSGLKNAALIARSISALGKPMLSIFAIASSRCAPRVRADGSLKLAPSADAAAAGAGAGAGDGVDGAFDVVFDMAGAGAAGVCAIAGAGVEGAFEEDEEAAGAALGWSIIRLLFMCLDDVVSHTFDIMQTMKPFSSMLYDSTVCASCKILPIQGAYDQHDH